NAIPSLGVGHMQDNAFAHAQQVDTLFAVRLAIIDPFNREGVASRFGGLIEGHSMVAPIRFGLVVIPLKPPTHTIYWLPVPRHKRERDKDTRRTAAVALTVYLTRTTPNWAVPIGFWRPATRSAASTRHFCDDLKYLRSGGAWFFLAGIR